MVQNIVNSINTWQDWHNFCSRVFGSETYKHGWFVYCETANEGEAFKTEILGKSLTEAEAKRIYEANKYAVEHNGTDYADIYYENLYDPNYSSCAAYVYCRGTGESASRAFELNEIALGVHNKFKAMGLYD